MKKLATRLALVGAAAALALSGAALVGCSKAEKKAEAPKTVTKLAVSHNSSLESPWQKASLKFADIVNTKSGGSLNAEVFGNGVLFQRNWQVLLEMCQSGATQIGIESVTSLGSKVEQISVMGLPFLFKDIDHVVRFLNSDTPVWNKWLTEGFQAKNLVVIAVSPRPFRQINNNKRLIKTPADLKGLKFRVPANPFFVKVFEAMGAKPVPLPSGEIYTAIQLGTVVGEDNSISVQYDFKTHEVAKNFTIWNYIADGSILFMNKDAWNKLSDAEKAIVKDAGKEWAATNVAEDQLLLTKARTEMEKAGVKFYEMSDAEKEPFKKLLKPIYDEYATKLGAEDFKAFMDAVEKTRQ